jgi:hypothetical protein
VVPDCSCCRLHFCCRESLHAGIFKLYALCSIAIQPELVFLFSLSLLWLEHNTVLTTSTRRWCNNNGSDDDTLEICRESARFPDCALATIAIVLACEHMNAT